MFGIMLLLCLQMPAFAGKGPKKSHQYRYEIAACLFFQNESFYLKEWIEYHKLIGVEHFYLFNNASTDNYLEILYPYILSGEVELFDRPTITNNQSEQNILQCSVYNDALAMAKGVSKWLAIMDADEFIVPIQTDSLRELLKKYEKCGGLYLCYLFFGTSHVEKRPQDRLVIETLNHSAAEATKFGKSIVRPERVRICQDPHRMHYRLPYSHVTSDFRTFDWTPETLPDDQILLHHYYTGDLDHYINHKFPRRAKWYGIRMDDWVESAEWMNARFNPVMDRFVPQLRKNMNLD